MPKIPPARLFPAAFAALAIVAVAFTSPADAKRKRGVGGEPPSEAQLEVQSLRKQIAALELSIALNLTGEQKAQLADVVADQLAERAARRSEREARLPELNGILTDYLAEVERSGAPSDATVDALRSFRESGRGDKEARKQGRGEVRDALAAILDESQQETLAQFRPMAAAGPSDEEREERREERGERIREHRGDRGGELSAEEMDAMRERKQRKRTRRHTKKVVGEVMFSPEFLELLR